MVLINHLRRELYGYNQPSEAGTRWLLYRPTMRFHLHFAGQDSFEFWNIKYQGQKVIVVVFPVLQAVVGHTKLIIP